MKTYLLNIQRIKMITETKNLVGAANRTLANCLNAISNDASADVTSSIESAKIFLEKALKDLNEVPRHPIAQKNKHRILLVDDDDSFLSAAAKSLDAAGFQVYSATTPDHALILLDSIEVDLLISDIRMAGCSGIDLLRQVKSKFPNLKFCVLSGYVTVRQRETIYSLGAEDVFSKPFCRRSFTDNIASILDL